jgi:hypothetical protein
MALHEQSVGATDEWYTPAYVFGAMGVIFDLDPAHPGEATPWCSVPAREVYSSGGLERPWRGFVWMNPPFGPRNGLVPWLAKFMAHGDGVALTPDRTSAPWWQEYAPQADRVLFVGRKIQFIGVGGRPGKSPAQGTTLLAKGPRGVAALENARANGLGLILRGGGA